MFFKVEAIQYSQKVRITMKQIFMRTEKKYRLNPMQYSAVADSVNRHLKVDNYGKQTINSIYFDTDSFRLIGTSVSKPVYKEKLRLRWYGAVALEQAETVYLELKKKYDGVVYKRRISGTYACIQKFLQGEEVFAHNQIASEIRYFLNLYHPKPKIFIACERIAYFDADNPNSDTRITFDFNMRYNTILNPLTNEVLPLIDSNEVLMEIKMPGAMPLWLAQAFDRAKAYPVSFSKCGTCYTNKIFNDKRRQLSSLSNNSVTAKENVYVQ